jgi:hypothetical protein
MQVLPIYNVTKEWVYHKSIIEYLNSENSFFFSYTYNLSKPFKNNFFSAFEPPLVRQPQNPKNPEKPQKPSFQFNDFVSKNLWGIWDSAYSKKESDTPFNESLWVIKLMHGYYNVIQHDIFANTISIHLISRRQIQNCGTRYNRRGLNDMGFTANFVETEQLVINETLTSGRKPLISSYLQVRGSVPLYWSQYTSFWSPKPPMQMGEGSDDLFHGSLKHFADLIGLYGKRIICMNLMKKPLLTKENQEIKLGNKYDAMLKSLQAKHSQ